MTAKTLKYNHSHNCPTTKCNNEQLRQEQPKQEDPKQEEHHKQDVPLEVVPKLTHREIRKQMHQNNIAKLSTQIL